MNRNRREDVISMTDKERRWYYVNNMLDEVPMCANCDYFTNHYVQTRLNGITHFMKISRGDCSIHSEKLLSATSVCDDHVFSEEERSNEFGR